MNRRTPAIQLPLPSRLSRRDCETKETGSGVLPLVLLNSHVVTSQMTVLTISVNTCFEFAELPAYHPVADAKPSFQRRVSAGLSILFFGNA